MFNSLEDAIKSINAGPITKEYDNTISGLVNDYNVFLVNQFKWKNNLINDRLHIVISNNKDIEKSCNIDPWYGGCYKGTNSTIYLKECSPVGMLEGIEHEIGHSLRVMPRDNNYLKELPSQANEFYAYFRLNSLNRTIGTYYVEHNNPPAMKFVSKNASLTAGQCLTCWEQSAFLCRQTRQKGIWSLPCKMYSMQIYHSLKKTQKKLFQNTEICALLTVENMKAFSSSLNLLREWKDICPRKKAQAFINLLYTKISQ